MTRQQRAQRDLRQLMESLMMLNDSTLLTRADIDGVGVMPRSKGDRKRLMARRSIYRAEARRRGLM